MFRNLPFCKKMPSPQDKSVIGTVKSKKGISLDMNREYLPYPGIERERERERGFYSISQNLSFNFGTCSKKKNAKFRFEF